MRHMVFVHLMIDPVALFAIAYRVRDLSPSPGLPYLSPPVGSRRVFRRYFLPGCLVMTHMTNRREMGCPSPVMRCGSSYPRVYVPVPRKKKPRESRQPRSSTHRERPEKGGGIGAKKKTPQKKPHRCEVSRGTGEEKPLLMHESFSSSCPFFSSSFSAVPTTPPCSCCVTGLASRI